MGSAPKAHVAFHLTGKKPSAGLEALDGLDLRPALFARYRNLGTLRYDFPLVLVGGGSDSGSVESLSGLVNRALGRIAQGDDGGRVTTHVLRLEQEIRVSVGERGRGLLSTLWDAAGERIGARTGSDELLRDSLDRARAALDLDGEVVGCDAAMPARLLTHVWSAAQEKRASQLRSVVQRLALSLSDILRADVAHSAAGQSVENLRASVGPLYEDAFDFSTMSSVLTAVAPKTTLSDRRRQRIQSLISVLEAYKFSPGAYAFTTCTTALEEYRVRLPEATALARAIAMAELEVKGEYSESTHDELVADFGAEGLGIDSEALARFPDYLICVNAETMDPRDQSTLMEILSAGLPMKILVQSDDILEESPIGDGHLGLGMRSRQLANMAIGLNEVFVLQTTSSHLLRIRDQLLDGLNHPGPALFSVFSGATGHAGDLPSYLTAAAAVESRAFPVFTYDPSAGTDWASRFRLDANPQVDLDWPIHSLDYEDEEHQRKSEDVAFTLVDFVASDRRYTKHFARVPRTNWNAEMIPVSESLGTRPGDPKDGMEQVPCVLMVDRDQTLQKVLVDEKLVKEARRCREFWHSLQELGGIHNSYAERQLARELKAPERGEGRGPEPPSPAAEVAPAEPGTLAGAGAASPEVAEERSADEAYIETARCTTCNECTQINGKMFAYNENRQAYIANPDAGTYAQLVEAAESCQVSIIHPGKPRDPNEPGLDELLKRAEAFR